jgi:hypothetical protein
MGDFLSFQVENHSVFEHFIAAVPSAKADGHERRSCQHSLIQSFYHATIQ